MEPGLIVEYRQLKGKINLDNNTCFGKPDDYFLHEMMQKENYMIDLRSIVNKDEIDEGIGILDQALEAADAYTEA